MRARRSQRSPRASRPASARSSRYRELRNLGELVIGMVHDTLDAFARLDTDLALEVLRRDRTVDEEYESHPPSEHDLHDGGSALDPPRARRHVGGALARAHRRSLPRISANT